MPTDESGQGSPPPGADDERWSDITPEQAVERSLNLAVETCIAAPLNEEGERCPWPWEPQQLVGVPLGQYHCPWCGAMVVAGVPHLDYAEEARDA